MEIRKHRLIKIKTAFKEIEYANGERILEELEFADKVMRRLGCKVIDVTKRAIEDTALIIMETIGYDFDNK
ncbi:putative pyruvate, phosphate dikinase regulatory protein [Clostridium homopropionicum DSM 5847]|uniref:Putative pyruvate, phosphate dikinase regulatory protein n=1 Tax=Clostridium homopropionicum DSM 5847 TaxID=1121318 RepID=A0A0L6Z8B1_9CLOT|nr:putative pyruvate, phosphate dikinase regulatory protein [Clostridium homopropionicum DSM 5847]SFG97523.1 Kinase/pyrophosphorylase [Clostridium homopropionicum]